MLTIDEARSALKKGKIIVYPTDTVWGIGCNPFDQESVDNLFKLKCKKELLSKSMKIWIPSIYVYLIEGLKKHQKWLKV